VGPEWARDDLIMRVDGDIFEVWTPSYDSKRIPLAWLLVRAHYFRRQNSFLLYIGKSNHGKANDDEPLYALKQNPVMKDSLGVGMGAEEEPVYRAFFTEVAQLCGRSVAPANGS
jgi:hypothetical protein